VPFDVVKQTAFDAIFIVATSEDGRSTDIFQAELA
jgi:hypothetical protein